MAETQLTDSEANALSGTTDSTTGLVHMTTGTAPWYTEALRQMAQLLLIAQRAGDLRVYKDGDLTFGVTAGLFLNGDAAVSYAGAAEQALTDDAVNYIYLTPAGALTVNTTGFPTPTTTAHLPLAAIAVGSESAAEVSSQYAIADITDYRGRALLAPACGLSERVPAVAISLSEEDGNTIETNLFVKTAAGAAVNTAHLLRVWISTTDGGAPSAADNTVAVTYGTTIRTLTAHADYELETDASGVAVLLLTVAGAATRWVMVECDGRVYSEELTFAA